MPGEFLQQFPGVIGKGRQVLSPHTSWLVSRGEGYGEVVSPSPADYGVWGSVVISPVGGKTSFDVFRA